MSLMKLFLYTSCVVLFFATGVLNAQQIDSLQLDSNKETPLEPIAQLQKKDSLVASSDTTLSVLKKIDGATIAQQTEDTSHRLQDLEEARRYDSLWLKELYGNTTSFKDFYEVLSKPISKWENGPIELSTDTLKARLERLNQKTPFNISYNLSLEQVIKTFLTRKRDLMERMLTSSQFYFPLFEQELDNHDIPLEMKYLAIVESALNPKARSRVGATGLWQFMYDTGRSYGLEVNSYVDERSDPIRATKAASRYLAKLHSIFDDWDLALAAYNSGPGNVNKAIRRSGGYTNYWNIRSNLPRETAGYVPAFLATMYVFEYADQHGLTKTTVNRPYFDTDTIHVKQLITFNQISDITGISLEELELLNPSYKLSIIPKIEGKEYALRLPRSYIGEFVTNEAAVYALAKQQQDSLEKPLPELTRVKERIRYRVRSGDYLGKIANRYGVRVSQIKRWNGMRNNNLKVGQRLTIFPRKPGAPQVKNKKEKTNTAKKNSAVASNEKEHIVQEGDSLWTISRQYPGISIENLREWNGLGSTVLKPGTKLKLCACPS